MASVPTQIYGLRRDGLLEVRDPTTLSPGTGWANPNQIPVGPAINGIAYDSGNNWLYLLGVVDGTAANFVALQPQPSGGGYALGEANPTVMPAGTFQPDAVTVDPTNKRVFVGDAFRTLTAWNTNLSSSNPFTQISGSPYYYSNGLIKAQGAVYDPNHQRLYTCCQDATGQDQLVVFDATTGPPMTQVSGSPFAKTLGLSTSTTSMAYDTTNNRILISSSLGLIVLDATSSSYAAISGSPFPTVASPTGFEDPRGVAFNATNGHVYVCNFGVDSLSVLTASTLASITGSPFPTGHGPSKVAYSASQNKVYVANLNGGPGISGWSTPGMSAITTPTPAPPPFTNLAVGP